KEKGLESSFIIMTAYGTIESAVEAMKEGAFDYITKPFSKDELLINIEKAVKAYNLYEQNIHLREELKSIYEERKIIGSSKETKKVNELIEKVSANESVNVLITGESGTGKELVAREIHACSGRADMAFVPVNCSAIPETLMESELFGYEKGAFTGAVAKRKGKFKRANGGTIFLDEIADMAMSMQVKLLRVIQDKEVVSVGGDEPIKVDIRIISATNRDIEAMVEKGNFRDDLYYRLNVVPIHIPPLRERRDDIPVLVDYIIEKLNKKLKKNIFDLSGPIMSKIMSYNFPGNIRELENVLERAYILAGSDRLRIEHFPILSSANNEIEVFSKVKALKAISGEARKRAEKNAIERALIETNWNRVKAAKLLEVDYKTLRRKMKELDIYPHYNDERSE
ncbi:MAG: sigma-54-dependent Fis family transcriptional regulator, partial [Spirochaetes bacterium]|nr:sigma-54-dependent Fis family transcriptional regulator [Spirochaetota bacterium]